MQLTDDQITKVKQWVAEGCGLSEIQKRLREEYNLALTFMDVRFLILDLGIELKDKTPAKPAKDMNLSKTPGTETELPDESEELAGAPPPAGGVTVEIDRVLKPGALVSGTVRFSDGVTAAWSLDQMGRLGLNVNRKDYKPSPEDIQAFQQELTRLIKSRGM